MTDPISRAAVLEILRAQQSWDTFPAMIRRVEALEGCGVRVKALEWQEGKHYGSKGRTLFAASIFGTYEVTTGWENGKASAHLSYAETAWLPDEAAALAFVQDAHNARSRAALEPVAQPETPTPGQFTTMCLAIEDVVTGRGFDVDPWRRIQDDPPPMDGTKFLAYAKHAQVLNGEFQLTECQFSQGWWGLSPAHNWPASFTHWQPLTKPGETTSAIPEEVKQYMREVLMIAGWRGERD